MKRLLVLVLLIKASTLAAQPVFEGSKKINVAVFSPMYLDSMFGAKGYKYGKEVPRFSIPGLDFAQGALIALDSMKMPNTIIDARVFDTKSYSQPVSSLLKYGRLDSMDLLIGSVRDADYKMLADFALQKNIPFISVTFPNDGGITANPFLVIMNSTLKAHCEAIYTYLLQEHNTDKIYMCHKTGDDRVPAMLKQLNEQEGHPMLNIQTLADSAAFNVQALNASLDSNRKTVFIGSTLDESFAYNVTAACAALKNPFNIKLIGMPNWDGFASLRKKNEALTDYPIYYTAPYYNSKTDEYSKKLSAAYFRKYKIKPSDNAFKGFESVWMFTSLMAKHPDDMMSNLNDKTAKIICDYTFKPVKNNKQSTIPDYFENKHVYFLKIVNGVASRAW